MKKQSKKGVFFGILGILAGGLIAVGFQVHAAPVQNPSLTAPQVQSVQTGLADNGVSGAKDNPESGTNIEKPDVPEANSAEADTNVSGGGHADPSGNVDHQFDGAE